MTSSGTGSEAGWYPDAHQPGRLRYYDGTQWTENYHTEGSLPTIAAWLSSTFGIFRTNGLHVFGLALGLWLISAIVVWVGLGLTVGELAIVNDELVGYGAATFVFGGLFLVVISLWSGFTILVLNRYLQKAHLHAEPSVGDALSRALSRLPKLVGFYLIGIAAVLIAVLLLGLVFVLSTALGVLMIVLLFGALFGFGSSLHFSQRRWLRLRKESTQ